MAVNYIWIKNKKYYYHETYDTWDEARKIALYYKKKNGSKYFILKGECGWLFPLTKYKLFLDKIRRLY